MKLTVLGCWAPYPAAYDACSGYLIEAGDTKLLLDIGHGSFSRLQGTIDFRKLDLAIISHFHPDHSADLSCLRHAVGGAIRFGKREQKLPIYVPNKPKEDYNKALKMTDGLEINSINDFLAEGINISGGKITFFQANHPLPTFGSVVTYNNKKLVYSADTGESEELVKTAFKADLLICEASLLEQDKAYGATKGHLTARGAAMVAKEAKVDKLLITHLWPEYDLNILLQEAVEQFSNTVLAKEELILEL